VSRAASEIRLGAAFSRAFRGPIVRIERKHRWFSKVRLSPLRNAHCKTVARITTLDKKAEAPSMEIRFISSLTAEDEDLFAPAVLKAVSAMLDQLPIAYTLRIETTGAQVFQHTHVATEQIRSVDVAAPGVVTTLPFITDRKGC
jgi:hypothetical protein